MPNSKVLACPVQLVALGASTPQNVWEMPSFTGFGQDHHSAGLWLSGNDGKEKKMETSLMGYIGSTIRIPLKPLNP